MHYFFIGQCSAAAAAKLLRSCPTLCDPIDGSPSGSPIPGILQARTLEWVAIVFCIAWKWKVKVNLLSRVRLLATPWTAAHQAPLSMGFARQEYWSGCHCLLWFNVIDTCLFFQKHHSGPKPWWFHLFLFSMTDFLSQSLIHPCFPSVQLLVYWLPQRFY